jgi:ADP-heptose:LPS heptosyltransferase
VRLCRARELLSLPIRPPADFGGHITELWREQLGLAGRIGPAAWTIPPAWRAEAGRALQCAGLDPDAPYAVLHAGAGAEDKCWPAGQFIELVRDLAAGRLAVLFVLGPVELERWPDERIAALKAAGGVVAAPPLTTLAGILAGARLFVGNDSGPAHLAAAVGTPTVALFGPSRAVQFAPLGPRVECIDADAMTDIAVAHVARAAAQLVRCPG